MREIEHRALHDALTGLPNRVLFRQRVEQALVEARRAGCRVGLALIDLDRFKEVNDTLGHQSGDQLLQELGVRLQGMVRSGETVARLGGDEFGVVSPFASDARSARALAERVRHGIERPLVMDDLTLTVEASVGIALFPDHGADVDTLMRHADVAMYVSKTAHATKIYAPEHDQYSYDRLAIVGELRRALANEELVLHYQPRVALASGELQGVEALVRWNHPGRGLLLPSEFIPAAEHTGLIRPITHYVLDAALRQCRAWRDEGREVPVAVNLSPRDLLDVGLPDEVCALLDKWGVEPDSLELEITERTVVTDPPRVQAVLSTLRERRIGLSLDDFGTGYSSLRHLRQLPVDIVKIDQSFVGQITTDRNDEIVVRSTIDLGHNLGLEVVAEGVADEETWSRLVALGCDTAQGFYISRPLTAGALTRWLANRGYEAASTAERRERDGEAAVVALARRRGNAYKQDSLVPAGHRPLAHLSGRR